MERRPGGRPRPRMQFRECPTPQDAVPGMATPPGAEVPCHCDAQPPPITNSSDGSLTSGLRGPGPVRTLHASQERKGRREGRGRS